MDNKALFKIGYGLYVLTAKDGAKENGCIVNTVMQVTSQPPVLAVCAVNKQNFTHDMIIKSGTFNLSVLTEAAPFEVYERFGFHSGRDTDKFAGFSGIKHSENGLPYLTDFANAALSFRVTGTADLGTHMLFTAEVADAMLLSDAPSVTYDFYQKNVKPKPAEKKGKGWRCVICGYVYEGEELPPDFICPLCKHGVGDFVKIE